MCPHAGVARKVNAFLASGEIDTESGADAHSTAMDKWLQRMEHQINTAIASAPLPSRPDSEVVMAWGQELGEEALHAVDTSMRVHGCLTYKVASQCQDAIFVSLVTGCHIPPCRLNLINSWLHPDLVPTIGCPDRDCRVVGSRCLGNRLELEITPSTNAEGEVEGGSGGWWFEYDNTTIISHVVHGKNEFRGQGVELTYSLPRGTLTKLLLAHIGEGHKVLTQGTGGADRLFVTATGIAFANKPPLFTQHWEKIMRRCPIAAAKKIAYFPPVAGRRIFVEGYTSSNGVEPDLWDGAAHVMGTSVRRWGETYNPSRKRRQAQQAVDNHSNYMANLLNMGNLDMEM